MDKLKPILAQKFWILLGIALLLPVAGWFLGTGRLAAAIDERVTKLNALNVPDGSTIPNDDWMKRAAVVEAERKAKLDTAGNFLLQEQQKYMTWPSNVRNFVKGLKFEDERVGARERYRSSYNVELENLLKVVDPLRFNDMTQKYEGKVVAESTALATLPPDDSIWPTAPPTSQEIWYLQEEMWLLRGLLEAVRNVNDQAGADSIVKAPIKQIDSIMLQGGDMAAVDAAGDPAAMEEGGMGDVHGGGPAAGAMRGMGGMGAMPGMGGEGGAGAGGGLDFDLAEEVGPNTPVASVGEEGVEGEMADPSAGGHGAPMMGPMGGAMGGGAAGANPLLAEKRYVDDDAAAPFKTRAFKMQVVMDHRQIPEFLVELTNSKFPVRILRVHWSEMNPDPRFAGTGSFGGEGEGAGGRGGMGAGRGGMGMAPMGGRGGMGGRGAMGGPMGGRGGMGGRGAMSGPMGGRGAMGGPMGGRGGMGMAPMGGRGGMGGRGAMGGPMGGRGGMGGPMGGRGGSPGMRPGGLPGMGFDGEGGLSGDSGAADVYGQAMSNPYLAQVVVGGLITIYRSPEEMAAGAAEAAEGATDAASEGADPAVTPVDGETVDGAAPADGAAPIDGAGAIDGAVPADEAGAAPEAATPGDGAVPADAAPPAGEASAEPSQEPAGTEAAAETDPSAGAPGEGADPDGDAAPGDDAGVTPPL